MCQPQQLSLKPMLLARPLMLNFKMRFEMHFAMNNLKQKNEVVSKKTFESVQK